MTAQDFNRLCALHGFDEFASTIHQYLLPSVGFAPHQWVVRDANSSRLGGNPVAPRSFEWPLYKGRPLDFLLQINLQEVNRHDSTGLLPSSGLLAFFYELEEQPWGYDPKNLSFFRVSYFPEGVQLFDVTRPAHRLNSAGLAERAIDFWPAMSLPAYGTRAWERLAKQIETPGSEFDFSSYDQLCEAVFRLAAPAADGSHHQLGGYSCNVQNDMQLEAELVMNGLYCGDASGYKDSRRPQLEKTCEQWQLLLQLDSDEKMLWGDNGMLYFWVRQSDLLRRDFSKTWMTLQCG